MTRWYDAGAPVRRVERDLPATRLKVVGETLDTTAPGRVSGWVPELAPEFDRARREGYEEGQREAIERMGNIERRRLHALASAVGDTSRKIEAERASAVAVAESDVFELALQLAQVIIDRELELASGPWRDAIRRALQLAPPETMVRLRLHPEDAAEAQADELLQASLSPLVTIVADHTVERSGAVADAGSCRIDAQIGSAIERVRAALQVTPEQP